MICQGRHYPAIFTQADAKPPEPEWHVEATDFGTTPVLSSPATKFGRPALGTGKMVEDFWLKIGINWYKQILDEIMICYH